MSYWYICRECSTARGSRALLQAHLDSSGHSEWRKSLDPPLHLSKLAPAKPPADTDARVCLQGGFSADGTQYGPEQHAQWLDKLRARLLD